MLNLGRPLAALPVLVVRAASGCQVPGSTSQPTTNTAAAPPADNCPTTYTGETVNLSGTITAVVAIGPNIELWSRKQPGPDVPAGHPGPTPAMWASPHR
jgi:hypothetical protein